MQRVRAPAPPLLASSPATHHQTSHQVVDVLSHKTTHPPPPLCQAFLPGTWPARKAVPDRKHPASACLACTPQGMATSSHPPDDEILRHQPHPSARARGSATSPPARSEDRLVIPTRHRAPCHEADALRLSAGSPPTPARCGSTQTGARRTERAARRRAEEDHPRRTRWRRPYEARPSFTIRLRS